MADFRSRRDFVSARAWGLAQEQLKSFTLSNGLPGDEFRIGSLRDEKHIRRGLSNVFVFLNTALWMRITLGMSRCSLVATRIAGFSALACFCLLVARAFGYAVGSLDVLQRTGLIFTALCFLGTLAFEAVGAFAHSLEIRIREALPEDIES
jgi:hypothetical protein